MSKPKNTKSTDKIPISSTKSNPKPKTQQTTSKSKGGLDEIESLFASKKESTKQLQKQLQQEEEDAQIERRRRKEARLAEEEEELALRGASTSTAAAAGKRKGDASAPQSLHAKAQTLQSLTYTRSDLQQLNSTNSEQKDKWASDGLGGVFNGEGYTGRRDDGGHRVFKAHLMNKEGFGGSKDCPFDCDCCFI
jgi:hypothetical protein